MENEEEKGVKVLVTGGGGYLASFLIKILLQRGYTVHATLRNLSDASKVGLLKGLAHAKTRLKLFEADIYNPQDFAKAIQDCSFVFHLATPLQHYDNNPKYKSTSEAAVDGVRIIIESCIKSKSVKKLIYTATIAASSPLKGDGSGYKDVVDESCWTPLDISDNMFLDYVNSKTLAEKEALSYNGKGLEVVSLACGLVGGDTIQSFASESFLILISQALNDKLRYKGLRTLEDLGSKLPIIHIQDVIEAHIFSMENPHMNGRFLLASDFLKSSEIASLIRKHYPHITISQELIEDTKRETKWDSSKLQNLGFQYKFDADKIICDSMACLKRLGLI